jgi:hypothetical protein
MTNLNKYLKYKQISLPHQYPPLEVNVAASKDIVISLLRVADSHHNMTYSLARHSAMTYEASTNTTSIGLASNKLREGLNLVIFSEQDNGTYSRTKMPMYHEPRSDFDFYYLALNGLKPSNSKHPDLVLFEDHSGRLLPHYAAEVLPAGSIGLVSSIPNHQFDWGHSELDYMKSKQEPIQSIKKIHLGQESVGGLNGLRKNIIDSHPDYTHLDTIELFPITDISGLHDQEFILGDDQANMAYVQKNIGNWGYDGTGFFNSISARYGTPTDLKELVKAAHSKGIRVILDKQLNHPGPDGIFANEFFDFFNPKEDTPWGNAINYTEPFVWELVLYSVKKFMANYHLDGLRLDMTQYLKNDFFLKALGHLYTDMKITVDDKQLSFLKEPVIIAEDARENPHKKLLMPSHQEGYNINAVWGFGFVNAYKQFSESKDVSKLHEMANYLINQDGLVLYYTSHDEQGNHQGFLNRDDAMLMLMGVSRNKILEFYPDFFHFVRDINGELENAAIVAEKIGLLATFSEKQWRKLNIISESFDSYEQFKQEVYDFHQRFFLDNRWHEKGGSYAFKQRMDDLKAFFKTNTNKSARWEFICKHYFSDIWAIMNDPSFNPDLKFNHMVNVIRRFRLNNPWMVGQHSRFDKINISDDKLVKIRTANPEMLNQQALTIVNFGDKTKRFHPLDNIAHGEGDWHIVISNLEKYIDLPNSIMPITSATFIELPPGSGLLLEKIF